MPRSHGFCGRGPRLCGRTVAPNRHSVSPSPPLRGPRCPAPRQAGGRPGGVRPGAAVQGRGPRQPKARPGLPPSPLTLAWWRLCPRPWLLVLGLSFVRKPWGTGRCVRFLASSGTSADFYVVSRCACESHRSRPPELKVSCTPKGIECHRLLLIHWGAQESRGGRNTLGGGRENRTRVPLCRSYFHSEGTDGTAESEGEIRGWKNSQMARGSGSGGVPGKGAGPTPVTGPLGTEGHRPQLRGLRATPFPAEEKHAREKLAGKTSP